MICLHCDTHAEEGAEHCAACDAPLLLDGRLRAVRKLGAGGSSRTYEVIRDSDGEHFALKVLLFEKVQDVKALELFRRQFEILSQLDHPGIPKVHEYLEATVGGVHRRYLVQDLIAGSTLADRHERYDEEQARALLEKMLDTVEYLHGLSPPVLHRDIKPENIVLTPTGEPVLIDFDTARGAGVDHAAADGTMVGSAGYVPMEQLAGQPVPASDIYALGMTLVSQLAQKEAASIPQSKMRPDFHHLVNVSKGFRTVLDKMLEPDVADRYQNVAEVRAALADRGTELSRAERPAMRPAQREAPETHTLRGLLVGAAIVCIAAAVWLLSGEDTPDHFLAVSGFSVRTTLAGQTDRLEITLTDLEDRTVAGETISVRLAPVEAADEGLGSDESGAREKHRDLTLTTDAAGRAGVWFFAGGLPGHYGVIIEADDAAFLPVAYDVRPDRTPPTPQCVPSPTGKGGRVCAVPAGWFMMGCSSKASRVCGEYEAPYHAVFTDAYQIDETEVTIDQYLACVGGGGCKQDRRAERYRSAAGSPGWGKGNHPIMSIDWEEAKAYCEWAGKRLPTEAEWERAAKGTDDRAHPWGDQPSDCSLAVTKDCKTSGPLAVCPKPKGKSPYGLCDMEGNAREWVSDWYELYPEGRQRNPTGPDEKYKRRVIRGASHYDRPFTTTFREGEYPGRDWPPIGIRCARTAD